MYRARPFLKLAPALCLCAPLAAWRNITTADNDARPSYTREEVSENDGSEGKPFWVIYKQSVYDLTTFRSSHPGGSFIDQAGGTDVEVFWRARWPQHFESSRMKKVLDETRVGAVLEVEDEEEVADEDEDDEEAEYDEPVRDMSNFRTFSTMPLDSETRPSVLLDSFITDQTALYIRNHSPVPLSVCEEDVASYPITIANTLTTLSDISLSHPLVSLTCVLQCAGNRQEDDFEASGPNFFTGTVFQDTSESGQVGNVTWEGHSLCDILRSRYPLECGEEERAEDSVYHVVFTGADEFESSTPLSTLLSRGDAILATRMNGSPLSRDHGHPVRAVLPGHVGCRNVKWLESIKLSKSPSSLPWNQRYYKDADGQHIQMLPSLQSIIFSASASSAGKLTVCGVAYTNGDASVSHVDVTTDGGKTWSAANVLRDDKEAGAPAKYSWSRWTATVDAPRPPKGEGQVTVHSRATDSAGGVQPE
eukprot:CAMPEP_0197545494 /NCGR_PEP_ID=MMETSP1320-20131121/513_1 /TAXON_ID=91990 /ORGANISM="Bolidomonas sp., Strain RCC2347" /LENGTH=476 /DNA_ID=CAMNT_0043105009 /DNA_START=136 /DNA_END=1563 /DNA_ORIENTATION=-